MSLWRPLETCSYAVSGLVIADTTETTLGAWDFPSKKAVLNNAIFVAGEHQLPCSELGPSQRERREQPAVKRSICFQSTFSYRQRGWLPDTGWLCQGQTPSRAQTGETPPVPTEVGTFSLWTESVASATHQLSWWDAGWDSQEGCLVSASKLEQFKSSSHEKMHVSWLWESQRSHIPWLGVTSKLTQRLQRTMWQYLWKLKVCYSSLFLGIYPSDKFSEVHQEKCRGIFIAASFELANIWNQLNIML